jgi:2-methylcitrate dehydratase PrpD
MAGISLSSRSLLHFHLSRHATQALSESHSTRVDVPKGDPRDPMTEEEIAVKFTALGGEVIGQDQCKKLQSFIMGMDIAKELGGLFELTTAR